jgi:hypothetical protein
LTNLQNLNLESNELHRITNYEIVKDFRYLNDLNLFNNECINERFNLADSNYLKSFRNCTNQNQILAGNHLNGTTMGFLTTASIINILELIVIVFLILNVDQLIQTFANACLIDTNRNNFPLYEN